MRRFGLRLLVLAAAISALACGRDGGEGPVVLTFAPAELAWAPTVGAPPAPLPVRIQSSRPVDIECATTATWLTVSPGKASAPATITVSASPAGLPAGTHTAQVTVRIEGLAAPLVIPARLSIGSDATVPAVPPPSPAGEPPPSAPTGQAPPPVLPEVPYGQRALSGEALERTKEATVLIESRYRPMGRDPSRLTDQEYAISNGSGFVIDDRGLVLTNEHVVSSVYVPEVGADGTPAERAARRGAYVLDRVLVRVHSGTERTRVFQGQVIATRPYALDLALVRIEPDTALAVVPGLNPANRTSLNFTASETHRVWAVGFPLGTSMEEELERFAMTKNQNGPDISVREGVVTAMRKDAHDVVKAVEHSCDIEPGNSGGPLVDAEGLLVGINSLGGGRSSFAIPLDAIADTFFDTLACNGYGNLFENASKRTLLVDPAARPAEPKAGEEPLLFSRIEDALAAARNGDVIRLAAAEFRLKEPLAIRSGIRLQGAGIGRTILNVAGPEGEGIEGYGVFVGGKRYVEVHDLTVVNKGGNGIWIYPEATDQMHLHDIEVRVMAWAVGAGENSSFDLIHCDLKGGVALHRAECRPRMERVRIHAENLMQQTALRTCEGASPLLIGCRLLGETASLAAVSGSKPRLVGCEIANLGWSLDLGALSASEGSEVEVEGCAFWSRGASVIAPSDGGRVIVRDSVLRGRGWYGAVLVRRPSSGACLERCLVQWRGPALLVAGEASASLDDCAVLYDPDADLSAYDWPEPSLAPAVAAPVAMPLTPEQQRLLAEEEERQRRERPMGIVVIGEKARVSYRGNIFQSANGGTAVRLEKGGADGDGGDNRLSGDAQGVLRTDDVWTSVD